MEEIRNEEVQTEEKPKKPKKKSIPCAYGVKDPKNVNGLNKEYILEFFRAKLADGSITREQIAEYKAEKAKLEKESEKRKLFASMFMPSLLPKEKKSFDDELDALING